MRSFIEDYLQDPVQAIANAREISAASSWYDNVDEDMVYAQIASPEFRLYEEMIFTPSVEDSDKSRVFAVVS